MSSTLPTGMPGDLHEVALDELRGVLEARLDRVVARRRRAAAPRRRRRRPRGRRARRRARVGLFLASSSCSLPRSRNGGVHENLRNVCCGSHREADAELAQAGARTGVSRRSTNGSRCREPGRRRSTAVSPPQISHGSASRCSSVEWGQRPARGPALEASHCIHTENDCANRRIDLKPSCRCGDRNVLSDRSEREIRNSAAARGVCPGNEHEDAGPPHPGARPAPPPANRETRPGWPRRRIGRRQHAGDPRLGAAPRRSVLRRAGRGRPGRADPRAADERPGRRRAAPGDPVLGAHGRGQPVSIAGREGAGFRLADEDLAGYVALDFDAFDAWYEEDEQITGHPRDPFHRIDVRKSARTVRIQVDGHVAAETTRARLLFETQLPVRFYLPREDVRLDLQPSTRSTYCPYKGGASYWSVDVGGRRRQDIAWSYDSAPGRHRDHGPGRVLGRARRRLRRRRAPAAPRRPDRRRAARRIRRVDARGGTRTHTLFRGQSAFKPLASASSPTRAGACIVPCRDERQPRLGTAAWESASDTTPVRATYTRSAVLVSTTATALNAAVPRSRCRVRPTYKRRMFARYPRCVATFSARGSSPRRGQWSPLGRRRSFWKLPHSITQPA